MREHKQERAHPDLGAGGEAPPSAPHSDWRGARAKLKLLRAGALVCLLPTSIGFYDVFPHHIVVDMMLSPYLNPFSKRTFINSSTFFCEPHFLVGLISFRQDFNISRVTVESVLAEAMWLDQPKTYPKKEFFKQNGDS
jgi:hypothetical protein